MLSPGKIALSWDLKLSLIDSSKADIVQGKQFIATASDFFENELWVDTLTAPFLPLSLNKNDDLIIVIKEIGSGDEFSIAIMARGAEIPAANSQSDSLNFFLSNGHFFHALSILHRMDRPELVTEVIQQYRLMFGYQHPGRDAWFNTYYDENLNTLVKMPYITKEGYFLRHMKRGLKGKKLKGRIEIYATMGPNNDVESLRTIPELDQSVVVSALKLLEIDQHGVKHPKLTLILKPAFFQWRILNRRALLNPLSTSFGPSGPVMTGAVHR